MHYTFKRSFCLLSLNDHMQTRVTSKAQNTFEKPTSDVDKTSKLFRIYSGLYPESKLYNPTHLTGIACAVLSGLKAQKRSVTISSHRNCLSAGGHIKGEKLQSLHITSSSSHPPINHTALSFAVELLAFAQCPGTPICHYKASKPFPTRWCLIIIQRPLTSTSSDP